MKKHNSPSAMYRHRSIDTAQTLTRRALFPVALNLTRVFRQRPRSGVLSPAKGMLPEESPPRNDQGGRPLPRSRRSSFYEGVRGKRKISVFLVSRHLRRHSGQVLMTAPLWAGDGSRGRPWFTFVACKRPHKRAAKITVVNRNNKHASL